MQKLRFDPTFPRSSLKLPIITIYLSIVLARDAHYCPKVDFIGGFASSYMPQLIGRLESL